MKQHEALGLALRSPLKANTKLVLITIIYKLDFSTWEPKPMSVSYIKSALNDSLSTATIERIFGELRKLSLIQRIDTGRADKVRSIYLNLKVLRTYADSSPQSEGIPQREAIPQSEGIPQRDGISSPPQREGIPQSEGLNPSERGSEPLSVRDNNNQLNNQSNNLIEENKSLNGARETWGSREVRGDNSSFWGTSSGRGLRPATQPRRQKTHQEKMQEAKELMKRTYAK